MRRIEQISTNFFPGRVSVNIISFLNVPVAVALEKIKICSREEWAIRRYPEGQGGCPKWMANKTCACILGQDWMERILF